MPNAQSVHHDSGTRLQTLALAEHEIAMKIIEAVTQLSHQSVYRLKKLARVRDFNPEISTELKLDYVIDKLKSDRSLKVTAVVEQTILEIVRKDRDEREKTSSRIEYEHDLASFIILYVLKRNNMRLCKIIKKSCLTEIMKKIKL